MWSRQKPIYLPIFLLTLFGPIYYQVFIMVPRNSNSNNAITSKQRGGWTKTSFFPPSCESEHLLLPRRSHLQVARDTFRFVHNHDSCCSRIYIFYIDIDHLEGGFALSDLLDKQAVVTGVVPSHPRYVPSFFGRA